MLEPTVIVLGWLPFVIITMLWVAGTSNAVNLTDGMDGLASGLVLIASLALMLLAYIAGSSGRAQYMLFPFVEGSEELMVVAGAMAGCQSWDSCGSTARRPGYSWAIPGSLPLGGLLAILACSVRQEILLIVIGAVFYWELLSVMHAGWLVPHDRRPKRIFPLYTHPSPFPSRRLV